MVAVSTSQQGVYDGITEVHRPFAFPRVDMQGNVLFEESVPGFFWYKSLGDHNSTFSEMRNKMNLHPGVGVNDLSYLFDGSCPLNDYERAVVNHSSELPVIQVIRRMRGDHLVKLFPTTKLSPMELLAYGIVHNHWIVGAAHLISNELGRRPTEHEVRERMKLDNERFYKEFRGYWGIMRNVLKREVLLIMPGSTLAWPPGS